jgi:hypothetical protein
LSGGQHGRGEFADSADCSSGPLIRPASNIEGLPHFRCFDRRHPRSGGEFFPAINRRAHLVVNGQSTPAFERFRLRQFQQVASTRLEALTDDGQTAIWQLLGAAKGEIVGRPKFPLPVAVEEAAILAVIIAVAGEYVEHGPTISPPDFAFVSGDATRDAEENRVATKGPRVSRSVL